MAARAAGKNERRDRIVKAARALMQRSGDFSFSMRTLADQARVSIATPYNLFGSKQAVLLAVLDDDLAEYQEALGKLQADEIEVLFQGSALLSSVLAREPEFYRSVLSAVMRDGPEFRFMVSGPRYLVWKRMLRQATEAGLLRADIDPDAFAIASSQLLLGNVMEWACGAVTLDEMDARNEYGLSLALMAVATDRSRSYLEQCMRQGEQKLQRHWRNTLMERLREGELDDETRALLADQLKHLLPETTKQETSS